MQIEVVVRPSGHPLGTDLYIKASIEVSDFGSPETGCGYMADPTKYDPGSGPEWSVDALELFHDCGGDGEPVIIGESLADALKDLIESDRHMVEQVESKIASAREDRI
jgi:hypothetical protein